MVGGRAFGGREGVVAGRPIHVTGSPIVFLLGSGTTTQNSILLIAQKKAEKMVYLTSSSGRRES